MILINSNTNGSEKVGIVGHSMGGLIARNYVESYQGGKAAKALLVGTPNQGSTLSYPLQVNGDVWTNDLIEKIGITLFMNHCGIPKSIQNILPTYSYLRDNATKQLKDLNSMKLKNNYLPTDFVNPFWGVKVGTLSGTGQSTLKIIDVIKDKNWPDGKPVDKETIYDGDGTVLVNSSKITGAYSNDVINQTHSGIIGSTEGINKILNFLGNPGVSDPPYIEPKSALVLVGYPGSFWITDKDGKVTQSENGMIALINPTDGDYQLKIIPTSINTTFVIGQFLKNGKVQYKEYKFKGLTTETKIIEFDGKNSDQDCMHEIKDFKKPMFPKFWLDFWNFWNKFHR